jgi:colicin import membrane protein
MKKAVALALIATGLCPCAPALVWAQDAHAEATDVRSLLETRKREQAAQFDAQEQACTKAFAVTDCVRAVNVRRRAVVSALRKEENALNDAERRQRERERLQSLQEKARQRAEQAPPMDANTESAQERLRRQQDKLSQHAPQSAPKARAVPKAQSPIDAPTRQQNATDYAARQKAANDRRAERQKRVKEQGKSAKDLPTPP